VILVAPRGPDTLSPPYLEAKGSGLDRHLSRPSKKSKQVALAWSKASAHTRRVSNDVQERNRKDCSANKPYVRRPALIHSGYEDVGRSRLPTGNGLLRMSARTEIDRRSDEEAGLAGCVFHLRTPMGDVSVAEDHRCQCQETDESRAQDIQSGKCRAGSTNTTALQEYNALLKAGETITSKSRERLRG